ncbi:hypothetical protein D8L93_08495 [Sodalis-like symbiont of Bactericera trigonica]|nr:hypothetical protein D8L93_08495 [Sodalis-like symbiont of Bactericera trigonica]
MLAVKRMGLHDTVHIQLHAKPRRWRHRHLAAANFQRRLGQVLITLLPNPVGIDGGNVTRRGGGHMGKHHQPDVEIVILVRDPHVSPAASQSWATGTEPCIVQKCGSASGISTSCRAMAWHICCQSVAIRLVAVGRPVARRNSAITSRPEKPCLAPQGSLA